MPRLAHVRGVAVTEFRRSLRAVAENRTQVVALSLLAAVFGVFSLASGFAVAQFGEAVRTGTVPEIPLPGGLVGGARGAVGLGFLAVAVMSVFRTVGKRATVDEPAALLLASRVRDVVPGVVLAEVLGFSLWVSVPVAAVVGGFALGAQAPLVAVAAPVAFVGVLLPAVWLGFLVGLFAHLLVTRYPPLARHRTALVVVALGVYLGLVFTGSFDALVSVLFEPMQSSPLSWYADLLLLGAPGLSASPVRAGLAVATTLVSLPLLQAASVRVADYHWFSDPARETEPESSAVTAPTRSRDAGLAARLLRPLDRPTRQIVRVAWTRTRRAPIKLLYLAYPVFGFMRDLQTVVETGSVARHVPFLLAFYVAWGTAMAFALNPFGDDGPALPAALTSPLSGRQFVTGHVLAGGILGVPVAVLLVAPAALVSPLSPLLAAGAVAVGVVGSLLAPALAVGVGVAFPRFGSVQVVGNRRAVVPSKTAMVVFSLALAGVGFAAGLTFLGFVRDATAALLGVLVAVVTPWELSLAAATLRPVGLVLLVLGLCSPAVSYVYAVRAYETYSLE
ncbi:hypothetical protein [Haloarchaeobius sp. TZWWS8]|uniref:hypothetical protein n=1 Tax=Haloarchaeobius sp. TZWWS8 TaxID=3446121 RepID=UPI003EBE5B83